MANVRHRIGLGSGSNFATKKNDVNAGGNIVKTPPFTFDSTVIRFSSTVRTFDETV